jgi:hypothetical protein
MLDAGELCPSPDSALSPLESVWRAQPEHIASRLAHPDGEAFLTRVEIGQEEDCNKTRMSGLLDIQVHVETMKLLC